MRAIIMGLTFAASFALGAQADPFASGSAFGGPTQTRAVCYLNNVGVAAISLTNPRIIDQDGVVQSLVIDECRGLFSLSLPAFKSCGIASNIANNAPYVCLVGVKDTDRARLRGVMEFRNADQTVLQELDLH